MAIAGRTDDDDINEILGLGDLIERAVTNREVAVYRRGGTHTLVADAHGPWAVQVPIVSQGR